MLFDETDKLRYFIRHLQPAGAGALASPSQHFVQCGSEVCLGRELYIADACITYYTMPTSPNGVRILLNVKNTLSNFRETLSKANYAVYKRTYPHFFELYERGISKDFRSAALLQIGDLFPCRSRDWAIVRNVDGVSPLSQHGTFLKENVKELLSDSISVIREVRSTKLDFCDRIKIASNRLISFLDGAVDFLSTVDKITTVYNALSDGEKGEDAKHLG